MKLIYSSLCILFLCQHISSQTKNEIEKRINLSELPETAQILVSKLPSNCMRLRFYMETDGDKQSFEAKFKHRKKLYSLEFSENGIIEDIEVVTKFKRIKEATKKRINNYFSESYTKHRLIKIQRQYIYSNEYNSIDFVKNILSENSKAKTNFEIIAEVKLEKARAIKEFTFNNYGTFLNFRVLKPTSYEHVLY